MNSIQRLRAMEQSDRLFVQVLGIVVTIYCIATSLFILNRSNTDPFASPAVLPERIARLIINLPVPAVKKMVTVTKQKKQVPKPKKRVAIAKKNRVKRIKKAPVPPPGKAQKKRVRKPNTPKKITGKNRVAKKNEATPPDVDLEMLGMLSLAGVIDETEALSGETFNNAPVIFKDNFTDYREKQIFQGELEPEPEQSESVDARARELTAEMEEAFSYPDEFEAIFSESDLLAIEQPDSSESYTNDGTRNSEIIQKIVSEYTNGMKFCYNNSLRKVESLKGTVVVKFTILGSGMTDKVSIISNEIRDQRLEHCIIGIIFRWEFPPSKIDNLVVTYPISFIKTS